MYTISGRVTVGESGLGLPNLVVAFYEVTVPGFAEGGDGPGPANQERSAGTRDRLGSVITGPSGEFSFSHGAVLGPAPSDPRPELPVPAIEPVAEPGDAAAAVAPAAATAGLAAFHTMLSVIVSAPDRADDNAAAAQLHVSPPRDAGLHEAYIIRIPTSALVAAGITPPTEPHDPAAALATLDREEEAVVALDTGVRKAAARRVGATRDERIAYERAFGAGLLRQLSQVPRTLVRPERLVGPGERVEPKNIAAIEDGVRARYSQASAGRLRPRTRFYLDQAQRDRLAELADDNGVTVLSADQVKALLLRSEHGDTPAVPPDLLREEDLLKAFLELSHGEKCGAEALGIATPEQDAQAPGDTPGESAATFDPRAAVAALLDGVAAPRTPGTERSDQASVAATLAGFAMRPAPADTPAFFDFHRLEVAFDDVWQEVLDGDVVDLARQAYTRVAELGGDPEHESHAGRPPLVALEAEADVVTRALAPAARALSVPRSTGNGSSSIFVPGHDRGGFFDNIGDWLGFGDDDDSHAKPADVMAPPTRPPRDLLGRLRAMLTGHHAFTAFGAGPGEHAVNFGIVTTFRQRWEPVTYQAGELVRTIPLAPGESRKYSRKTVINRKRAEKELAKWSEMRRDEQNTTSRAESEIVRKASAKTNFSLTTEGTYNIGIAKGDATTKIGRDAAQDAGDTKKEFREAVRKAAQEYKQERSLEVSTEDSAEFTTGESGEISNPNDELAVTYLFYELQRRYRVDERIHRVRPVVLVAQDMPNPAQITDAWLVAHDWILPLHPGGGFPARAGVPVVEGGRRCRGVEAPEEGGRAAPQHRRVAARGPRRAAAAGGPALRGCAGCHRGKGGRDRGRGPGRLLLRLRTGARLR